MPIESRIDPRVKVRLPAQLKIDDRISLGLWTENISVNGLMLEATKEDFQLILTNSKNLHLHEPVEVDLKFNLPGKTTAGVAINVHCRAIYVRRQSQNRYYIGFKFLKIAQRGKIAVSHFVNHQLAPTINPMTRSTE